MDESLAACCLRSSNVRERGPCASRCLLRLRGGVVSCESNSIQFVSELVP